VPFLFDCAVTGSDVGTATKPCFPLKHLWEYTLIPAIAQLVQTGGPCDGATVVVQQDNAGPHIEERYRTWMHAQFEQLGWMYEPQAPQGNVIANKYNFMYERNVTVLAIVYRAVHKRTGPLSFPFNVSPT
jgi:hypothetical protein